MNHVQLAEYALQKPGTTLKYPFDPDLPVGFVGSKMFILLGGSAVAESVNLKGDPEQNWLLREEFPSSIAPGYHMNKRHWNTIILNGTVPQDLLLQMVDESYFLVFKGLPKLEKEQISKHK